MKKNARQTRVSGNPGGGISRKAPAPICIPKNEGLARPGDGSLPQVVESPGDSPPPWIPRSSFVCILYSWCVRMHAHGTACVTCLQTCLHTRTRTHHTHAHTRTHARTRTYAHTMQRISYICAWMCSVHPNRVWDPAHAESTTPSIRQNFERQLLKEADKGNFSHRPWSARGRILTVCMRVFLQSVNRTTPCIACRN